MTCIHLYVGSTGLAVFSAIVTFFFIRPIEHDGMEDEDRKVRSLYPPSLPSFQSLWSSHVHPVPRIPRAARLRHVSDGSHGDRDGLHVFGHRREEGADHRLRPFPPLPMTTSYLGLTIFTSFLNWCIYEHCCDAVLSHLYMS